MTQFLTNPPPAIDALADMLDLCSSWGGANIYYPTAADSVSGTFAVISPIDEQRTRYAEGAVPIPSGSLLLTIYKDDTIGNVETLAQAIQKELLTLSVGLLLRSATVGRCAEAGDALTAGGETRKAIDITIEYGLNQ